MPVGLVLAREGVNGTGWTPYLRIMHGQSVGGVVGLCGVGFYMGLGQQPAALIQVQASWLLGPVSRGHARMYWRLGPRGGTRPRLAANRMCSRATCREHVVSREWHPALEGRSGSTTTTVVARKSMSWWEKNGWGRIVPRGNMACLGSESDAELWRLDSVVRAPSLIHIYKYR